MNAGDQSRRVGRPPKSAAERKTATMRFRVREDLREKIEAAAEASGRSVHEEAEIRLHNSFSLENVHEMLFGQGNHSGKFVLNLSNIIKTIQDYQNPPGVQLGNADWSTSDLTRAALRSALGVLIENAIPRPRTAEEMALKPDQERQYERLLADMKEFGEEYALLLTGQLPDLEADLDRGGAAEH